MTRNKKTIIYGENMNIPSGRGVRAKNVSMSFVKETPRTPIEADFEITCQKCSTVNKMKSSLFLKTYREPFTYLQNYLSPTTVVYKEYCLI